MTYFTPIEENKAKGKVKRVFDNIKKERKITKLLDKVHEELCQEEKK